MQNKTELQNVVESIDAIFASMNRHNLVCAIRGALEGNDPELSSVIKSMRNDRSVIRCPCCDLPITWIDIAQLWARENKARVVMEFLKFFNENEIFFEQAEEDVKESE